jgi:hypothetical protein
VSRVCQSCVSDYSLVQYASNAVSPNHTLYASVAHWTPAQATGNDVTGVLPRQQYVYKL